MTTKKEVLAASIGERLMIPKGMHKGVPQKQSPKNLRHKNNEGTRKSHAKEASHMETTHIEETKSPKNARRQEAAFTEELSTLDEMGRNFTLGLSVGAGVAVGAVAVFGLTTLATRAVNWVFGSPTAAIED